MSFTLDFFPDGLPDGKSEAFNYIEKLRENYYDDEGEKSLKLVEFHDKLVEVYPCLCSFDDDDPKVDDSPWADGPLINNFASQMGMVAVVYSKVDEVIPAIIDLALKLGITVYDGQSDKIYRP